MSLRNRNNGFTLVELLVVIAIIGMLMALCCLQLMVLAPRLARRNARITSGRSRKHLSDTTAEKDGCRATRIVLAQVAQRFVLHGQ